MRTIKKLKTGKEEQLADWEFDPSKAKITISIRLDGDVLEAIKADALKRGVKYQPLINQLLKEQYFGHSDEDRIRRIVREELSKTG